MNSPDKSFIISNDSEHAALVSETSDRISGGRLSERGNQDMLSNFDSLELQTSINGISLIAATDELGQTLLLDPISFAENYPDDANVVADFLIRMAAVEGHTISGNGLQEVNSNYSDTLSQALKEEMLGSLPPLPGPEHS